MCPCLEVMCRLPAGGSVPLLHIESIHGEGEFDCGSTLNLVHFGGFG